MGYIIYKTLAKTLFLIIFLWYIKSLIDFNFWLILVFAGIFFFLVYPFTEKFRQFTEDNKEIIEDSICSQCKSFDETAVICTKYDEHPAKDFVPCGGSDFEPGNKED